MKDQEGPTSMTTPINMSEIIANIAEAAHIAATAIAVEPSKEKKDEAIRKYISSVEPAKMFKVMMFVDDIVKMYLSLISECDSCARKALDDGTRVIYDDDGKGKN